MTGLTKQAEVGQTYWTCEPSIESAGHGVELVRPWLGKVSAICTDYNKKPNGNFRLSYFNKETGECDLDSNATAYCKINSVFTDEKSAWEEYYTYILQKESEIMNEVKFTIEKLKDLI